MYINKNKLRLFPFLILIISSIAATSPKTNVDLIVFNATIYSVDKKISVTQAMAIKDGLIVELGTTEKILNQYSATEKMDAKGNTIFPGFIDAHAHFYGYGLGLQTANLVDTKSWDEILKRLSTFSQQHKEGWLIGRGWDQNDWADKNFPTNERLNVLFPDRPVLLKRIDGHAAIANEKALQLAGVQNSTNVMGGEVILKNGKLTGVLVDNAVELVSSKIPAATETQINDALIQAQKNCFAVGLTTVDDCGLDANEIMQIKILQEKGILKMKVYAMLSDSKSNYDFIFAHGKIKTTRLNVSSFKVYADGALGSRGACLLQPYSDQQNHSGFLLSNPQHFDSVAALLYSKGFQMCTHAIGDSGNRTILNIYAKYLKGKNDLRWRIEHAQVINENDFHLFGDYSIIPSVQPTHATSDMYWAKERLGNERVKGAYAYKQLLDENSWIPLGTDFPVEDISPFKTFYAAVVRKDAKGWPDKGFQIENALTREQALRGMTIWAARANFEENEKGSLEKGKSADFILLDKDLMKIAPTEILNTKVIATFVEGEKVFGK